MKYLTIILIFIVSSCELFQDCKQMSEDYKLEECLLIVNQPPDSMTVKFAASGTNIITKKKCDCVADNRWWNNYSKYIERGDTIIKRRGKLTFSIHKKDTVLNFKWSCGGKEYE
ncbi:hypothetical protein [Flavobacterium cerinum]|uniref:Lipoprotein n=1 Tax=Flavobacterium cerinum TaxID=2502784 RepID=A0ABY5IYE1_9FLAO|nr:hypothetical protein [Flavobacterium cerinum]UUC46491.1 hypothetical protein NOX80_04645 [Flavobacterium cerinum]